MIRIVQLRNVTEQQAIEIAKFLPFYAEDEGVNTESLQQLTANPNWALFAAREVEAETNVRHMVGVASMELLQKGSHRIIKIREVALEDDWRQYETASRLIAEMVSLGRAHKAGEIVATTVRGDNINPVYEKLGFKRRNGNTWHLDLRRVA